ncbi:unnamed protein product, partial [Closterium sp. NIES-54]
AWGAGGRGQQGDQRRAVMAALQRAAGGGSHGCSSLRPLSGGTNPRPSAHISNWEASPHTAAAEDAPLCVSDWSSSIHSRNPLTTTGQPLPVQQMVPLLSLQQPHPCRSWRQRPAHHADGGCGLGQRWGLPHVQVRAGWVGLEESATLMCFLAFPLPSSSPSASPLAPPLLSLPPSSHFPPPLLPRLPSLHLSSHCSFLPPLSSLSGRRVWRCTVGLGFESTAGRQ